MPDLTAIEWGLQNMAQAVFMFAAGGIAGYALATRRCIACRRKRGDAK